ncbi:MAG: hypothetical protein QOH73_2113, partial [Gaiellaceae bacterium]|nr:hypothetical protein [Gaiellaceae bacterium]
ASPNVGFDLLGPGIHRMTGDVWYGTQRWTVRLRRGTYAFRMRRAGSVDSGPKGEPVVGNPQAAVSVRVS